MQQEQNKPSAQSTDEEASHRLRQMSAREENVIEVTEAGIWVSHANTPYNDLNLRRFIEELEQGGITVEAQSFYCG